MPSKGELRRKWNNAGENVVVLHQDPRPRVSPSASPYPLKLETFLRMADIKYELDFTQPMSKKNKTPWITFNGYDIADSQICIDHLAKVLNKDLSAHLTSEERAVARSMRSILEDHFYFCFAMEKWVYGDLDRIINEITPPLPIPKIVLNFLFARFKKSIKGQCEGQGIGRHTPEEVRNMGIRDLKAVSEYLGDKPYVMGDKPTEIDCVLFGFITIVLCTAPDNDVYKSAVLKDMTNLKRHFEIMKERFFPDWEECKYKEPNDGKK